MANINWKENCKKFILASAFLGSAALVTLGIYSLMEDKSDTDSNAFEGSDPQAIMSLASALCEFAASDVIGGALITSPFVLALGFFVDSNITEEWATRVIPFFDEEGASSILASNQTYKWEESTNTTVSSGNIINPISLIPYKNGFVLSQQKWEAKTINEMTTTANRSMTGYQYYEGGRLNKEEALKTAKPDEIIMPLSVSISIEESTFVNIYTVMPNPVNVGGDTVYTLGATLTDSNGHSTSPTIIASSVADFDIVTQTQITDGKFAILTYNPQQVNCIVFNNKLEQENIFPIDLDDGRDICVAQRLPNGNLVIISSESMLLYSPDGTELAKVSNDRDDIHEYPQQVIPVNGDIVITTLNDMGSNKIYTLKAFDGATLAPVDKKVIYNENLDKPYDAVELSAAASINDGDDIYVVYPSNANNGTLVGQTFKYDKSAHDKEHSESLMSRPAAIASVVTGAVGFVVAGLYAGYGLFSQRGKEGNNYSAINADTEEPKEEGSASLNA